MKYSSKYDEKEIITDDTNHLEYSVTDDIRELYTLGEATDISVAWAVPEVLPTMYAYNLKDCVGNYRYVKAGISTNVAWCFGYRGNISNWEGYYQYIQTGVGGGIADVVKSANPLKLVRNLNTSNIVLTGTGRTIKCYLPETGSEKNYSINDVVIKADKLKGWIFRLDDIIKELVVLYIDDDYGIRPSYLEPIMLLWSNIGGGVNGITSMVNTSFAYGYTYTPATGTGTNTSAKNYKDFRTASDSIGLTPVNFNTAVTDYKGGSYYDLGGGYWIKTSGGSTSTAFATRVYCDLDTASSILASLGCYFLTQASYTKTATLESLIDDGYVVLGEMLPNGHTTGNWITEPEKIRTAINYKKDMENESLIIDANDPRVEFTDTFELGKTSSEGLGLHYYAVTGSECSSFVEWLNTNTEGSTVDNIVGLFQYPCAIPSSSIGEQSLIIAGKNTSTVSANALTSFVNSFNFGYVYCWRKYNDFRDFEPYCTYEMYLPFIGVVPIPTTLCAGHYVHVHATIDWTSGQIAYYLCIDDSYSYAGKFVGSMSTPIAVSATNKTAVWNALLNSTISTVTSGIGAVVTGSPVFAMNTASNIISGMNDFETRNDTMTKGSLGGYLQLVEPLYVLLRESRTEFEIPDNYNHTNGFPCDCMATVDRLNGYTVCTNVDVSSLTCSNEEKEMIKQIFESGVYL